MNIIFSKDRRSKFLQLTGAMADKILTEFAEMVKRQQNGDDIMVQYKVFLLHTLTSNNEQFDSPDLEKTL